MYINFQQIQVSRSVKNYAHKFICKKNHKLNKFATCNWNFEKSRLSDLHNIQTEFENNRAIRYQITAKNISTVDNRTEGRTDGQADDSFFEKKKTY